MPRANIMIDLETLGTSVDAAVVAIGATYFDRNGPCDDSLGDRTFYAVIDFQSCIDAGLRLDGSTIEWWLRQKDKPRHAICDSTHSLKEALEQFSLFVERNAFIWGNGSEFDNAILKNAYRAVGLPLPWKYSASRCFRTLRALFPQVEPPEGVGGVHHNALDDALYQAHFYSKIINRNKNKTK